MIVLLIVLIIAVLFIKFLRSNYQFKYDFITFFEGSLGSGKTTMLVYHTKLVIRKRLFKNYIIKFVNYFLPKKWKLEYHCTKVYSNFPIFLGKKLGWSYRIDEQILNWYYKVEKDCIIVLDEVGFLYPNSSKVPSLTERFCLTWLRHCTNAIIFSSSQSLSECNITFRRKANHVYELSNCKRGFLFSHINVLEVYLSENISTIHSDSSSTFKDNHYYFRFPKKMFKSTYGENLYLIPKELINHIDCYSTLFEMCNLKIGEQWVDYDIISLDDIELIKKKYKSLI